MKQTTSLQVAAINFHAMNKAEMIRFASDNYNEILSPHLPEYVMRHKLISLFIERLEQA